MQTIPRQPDKRVWEGLEGGWRAAEAGDTWISILGSSKTSQGVGKSQDSFVQEAPGIASGSPVVDVKGSTFQNWEE